MFKFFQLRMRQLALIAIAASLSSCTKNIKKLAPIAEDALIGSWTATNPQSDIVVTNTLMPDHKFSSICRRGEAVVHRGTGTWVVRNNVIIWIYGDPATTDPNPITEFTPNKFTIKEVQGTLSTFVRIPDER